MKPEMTEYYKEKLAQGTEFQDFIALTLLDNLGFPLSCFNSKKYQYQFGENRQGVEIKFDDRFKETGNLFIEIAEKTNAINKDFIPSGIMRNDNSWLYVIGNYQNVFIFGKTTLKHLYKSGRYRQVEIPTSKGFLLDTESVRKYAEKTIIIDENKKQEE